MKIGKICTGIRKSEMNKKLRTPKMFAVPPLWQQVECPVKSSYMFLSMSRLKVVYGEEKIEGMWWRHLSLSRQDRVPSYDDLTKVKSAFAGDHRAAVMVLPKKEEHINIHPNCLHLWWPVNEEHYPLPDFRLIDSEGRAAL